MARTKSLEEMLSQKKKRHRRRRGGGAAVPVVAGAPGPAMIAVDQVRTDGDTQPRVSMDPETVEEYVARMRQDEATGRVLDLEGQPFPPLVVYRDADERLWLADGFHRLEAARRLGISRIQAELRAGSLQEALVHSLGANARHGKRRTNADKRRAVARALAHDEIGARSDARVAAVCKVSDRFVSGLRQELICEGAIPYRPELCGADGKWRPVDPPPGLDPGEGAAAPSPIAPEGRAVAPRPGSSPLRERAPEPPTSSLRPLEALAEDDPLGRACLVVHPLTLEDFELVAAHAARVLERGRMILPAPQGTILGLTGPAQLGRLLIERDFTGPHHVHVREHDRVYLCLRRGADVPEVAGVSALEALTDGLSVHVYGAPLDDWGS